MPPTGIILAQSLGIALAVDRFAPQYSLGWIIGTCILFVVQSTAWLMYNQIILPKYFSPLRHLPLAPDGHWLLGHIPVIFKEISGYPMRRWIENVPNNGMIRYSMWFTDRILITKPALLSEVLVTKNYDFIKPNHIRVELSRLLGVGILLAEGDDHKAQRKTLMPAFAFRHVKNLYPVFWKKAKELIDCVDTASQPQNMEDGHPPGAIDVSRWSSRATLDIIGISGMGRDFDSLHNPKNKLSEAYQTMFSRPSGVQFFLMLLSMIVPRLIIDRIPIAHRIETEKAVDYVREVCQGLISQKRQSMEKKDHSDIDILSVAMENGGFTDKQLIDQLMTFLAAGHETTATAMSAAMIFLCRNPRVQDKLREEIRASIPPPSADITSSDIDDCQYLQAVCNEILRLWSPVSMTFRVADRDTTVGGEFLPKGTMVNLCPWAVNASTALWGEDAHEFKPERWLDADGKANNHGSASSNYSFLTFLHGPRSCIGQRFAQAEFACLIAAWVGTFETTFEEGSVLKDGDGGSYAGITNKPKEGVWCNLRRVPGWE